jgi:nucleoside-diphosphate kinase
MSQDHPKYERTFVILKPDAVQRSLVGEILGRFEKTGLKVVAMKFLVPTRAQALKHYNKNKAWCEKVGNRTIEGLHAKGKKPTKTAYEYGKDVLDGLVDFFTASPVLALVLEGNQAVGVVKKLVGGTEPLTSDPGTIRGDLTNDSYEIANLDNRAVRNLIHCTDDTNESEREIKVWFKPAELVKYKHINERMLYDVNLDGILD